MSAAAVFLLALGLWVLGSRLGGLTTWEGQGPGHRLVVDLLAGLVGLYVLLLACDAVGIPWKPLTVTLCLALGAAAAALLSRGRRRRPAPAPRGGGWGEAVAAVGLVLFAVCAVQLWIVYADFVYHWGIKGHKFFLAGGIDYGYLSGAADRPAHPAYPHLLPALFAVTAAAAGGFAEPAMMLWSAVFFALLLLAAREVLARAGVSPFAAASTLAALALAVASFGIGYSMAGSPDWLLALVPVAAWPALTGKKGPATDLAVGLLAAVAAGAKIEGMALAGFLLAVYLAVRGGGRLAALPRLLLPAALVVLPWLLQGLRHGLLGELGGGDLRPELGGTVLGAMAEGLNAGAWHRASYALLALPLVWLPRFNRPVAAVCTLQLLFYLWVYLTLPYPPDGVDYFVRSNFARLLFHLLPAVILAAGVALDRWAGGGREGPGGRSAAGAGA